MKPLYPSLLKKMMLAFCAAVSMISAAEAQSASATWGFNNASLAASTTGHLTAGSASLGPSIVSNAFNCSTEYYGQDGWPTGSIDLNAYLQFTVTSNSAYYLVLNTVALTIRRSNTGNPDGAGPNTFSLRSSLDNYSTDIYTSSMTDAYVTYTITLPVAFQAIPSSVTFRLYGYNTTINSGGSSRFVYDNIVVSGSANAGTLAARSLDLSAEAAADAVSLRWNPEGFEAGTTYSVERSVDGNLFSVIDQASTASSYSDMTLPAVTRLYYRVLAQSPDGSTLLSPIATVSLDQASGSGLSIRSVNAQGSTVRSLVHIENNGTYQLALWSQDGRNLYRQVVSGQTGDLQTDMSLGLRAHGIYILTVSGQGQQQAKQFVY